MEANIAQDKRMLYQGLFCLLSVHNTDSSAWSYKMIATERRLVLGINPQDILYLYTYENEYTKRIQKGKSTQVKLITSFIV